MSVWFSIGLSREQDQFIVSGGSKVSHTGNGTKNLANFSRKLHKNENNWAEREEGACVSTPPNAPLIV